MTFPQKWLLSRPSQWLRWQNVTNWLLSRPLCFAPNLDSFQDPHVFGPKLTHFKSPCSELLKTSPNWLISRPSYWFITVFQSPWETTFKLTMLNLHRRLPPSIIIQNTIHSEFQDFIVKQKEKDSSHADNRHISRPKNNTFYTEHRHFHQNWFLSRPQKLHLNRW